MGCESEQGEVGALWGEKRGRRDSVWSPNCTPSISHCTMITHVAHAPTSSSAVLASVVVAMVVVTTVLTPRASSRAAVRVCREEEGQRREKMMSASKEMSLTLGGKMMDQTHVQYKLTLEGVGSRVNGMQLRHE